VREILAAAASAVAARFGLYTGVILVVQGLVFLAGVPLVSWLLGVLLGVVGERIPATVDAVDLVRDPVALALLLLVVLVIAILGFAMITVLLMVADRQRRGREISRRTLLIDAIHLARRLRHRSTLLLVPYLALLVPVNVTVFGGVFTSGLRVPAALGTELLSSPPGTVVYFAAAALAVYLNLRLILTLPILIARERTVGQAIRGSWRLTRGQTLRALVAVGAILGSAAVVVVGFAVIALGPTRYTDDVAPDWSPGVAVASLTAIELGIFFLAGFALALIVNAALAVIDGSSFAPATGPTGRSISLRVTGAVAALALVAAIVPSNITGVATVAGGGSTLVVAHRGLESGGVENTLSALKAAAAFGPDFLEIDVQETRDGELVVFHDATLERLSGDPRAIGDLTLAELRRVPLRQNGAQDRIATLEQFVRRAVSLDQRLLIELKVRGDESPEFLPNIIEILDRYEVADQYRVASFDKDVIEEFAELAPATPAGYVVRVGLGIVPPTTADFLVINYSAYSPALRDEAWAAGLEIMVWTVDDMRAVRDLLRDSVDGIITNRAHAATAEQQEIVYETGVAARLEDVVRRAFGL
jgi:glycerophosphoryl diester phosphodiesterase